jgi:hypothetical protein
MTRRLRGDDGASLLMVLVFLILISVLTLSMLELTQTSFEASGAVLNARQDNNAADAAIELGIRKAVLDSTVGTPTGSTCGYQLVGANSRTATVRCAADGSAGGGGAGRAANAVLALTGDISVTGNDPLGVTGNVFSHTQITTGQPQNIVTITNGQLTALTGGDCSNTTKIVVVTNLRYCTSTPAPPTTPAGVDPGWTSAAGASFVAGARSSCTTTPGGLRVATFAPGKYTTSPAAAAMLSGCANPDVLYFPPVATDGSFYFEDVAFNTGNFNVVAGTAPIGAGSWLTDAAVTTFPASAGVCDNTLPGSQFILGGSTTFTVPNKTNLALCAGPPVSATQPPIAVYGPKTATTLLKALPAGVRVITTNKQANTYVQGALYAPVSDVFLSLHQKGETYFTGGVITGSMTLDMNPSSVQTGDPISLPACSVALPCATNRRVIFTASINSVDLVRAVVQFNDIFSPSQSYSVDSWNVLK